MYSDEIICTELKRIADSLEKLQLLMSNFKLASQPAVEQTSERADLLTVPEAAKFLGVAKQTLDIWRSSKRYNLPFLKVGRIVRYKRADLDRWLANRRLSEVTF
jgi:excisionase family DNA binding protein